MKPLLLLRHHWAVIVIALGIISITIVLHVRSRADCTVYDDQCRTYRKDVKLAIVTTYYRSQDDKAHASELDVSLASLVGNPMLDQVHVLVEPKDQPLLPSFAVDSPKVAQHVISKRPLVGEVLQFICDHQELYNHRVLLVNPGIAVDSSLEYFVRISDRLFDSTFYAITRRSVVEGMGLSYTPLVDYGSSDTWAFKPQTICKDRAKLNEIVSNLNYPIGQEGSENRMLFEIKRQYPRLKWVNPCKSVRTFYVHSSIDRDDVRRDRVKLDGKSFYLSKYDIE